MAKKTILRDIEEVSDIAAITSRSFDIVDDIDIEVRNNRIYLRSSMTTMTTEELRHLSWPPR